MHLFNKKPTAFGLGDLLEMINSGYDYVSRRLGVKLGRIESGYEADLLLVPYTASTAMDQSNALGHIFFGMMHAFKPSDVFIAGEQLVKNYELTNKKIVMEYERSQAVADQLWQRIKGEK